MSAEFRPNANFEPTGPFVGKNFVNQEITYTDVIISAVIWVFTLGFMGLAIWTILKQMKSARSPLRSLYIWLAWIEIAASLVMGIVSFLHLLKVLRPSFAVFLAIVLSWSLQVQLLLQIIINRIRVIMPDRRLSKQIMIVIAVITTAINISVLCIWIPAQLQVNRSYVHINTIWDRLEKVFILIMDAWLNWYFLKTVKANLINNGLQKYNKLLRFNQRIIIVSLLMDVMIIAAMSIPNSFVYTQFHPFAYIVKLNIEMTMANLIKKIAISTSKRTGNVSIVQEFASSQGQSSSNPTSHGNTTKNKSRAGHTKTNSLIELSSGIFPGGNKGKREGGKTASFMPTGTQIKKTEEVVIKSEPNPEWAEAGKSGVGVAPGLTVRQRELGLGADGKSLDDITEGGSLKSDDGRARVSTDDEATLVKQGKHGWRRLPE